MPDADSTPQATPPTPGPFRLRNFILSGRFVPYLVFGSIGVAVLVVTGSIAMNAFKNKGLLPKPNVLARYDCVGAAAPFAFFYLHGADRVQIKSPTGILEGTVSQNVLDWGSFAGDASMVGFLPPTEIAFEDASTLRFKGAAFGSVVCTIAVARSSGRREIAQ